MAAQGVLHGDGDLDGPASARSSACGFKHTEGAKFWMQVLNELHAPRRQDILICCVDGLKGFPEAIEAIFPQTIVQTCIVHLIRASLRYVPRRDYEKVVKDLKPDLYRDRRRPRPRGARGASTRSGAQQLPPVVQSLARDAGSTSPRSWPSRRKSGG